MGKGSGINGIVMADLHWGAIHPGRFESELDSCLFKHLEACRRKNEPVDFIVIAGDTFDVSEYTSSLVTRSVIRFYHRLLDYTDKIFVVEGTRSHDALQSSTLDVIFNEVGNSDKFEVIQTIKSITYKGIDILFIPEEYVSDSETYYKEYFQGHYDLVFGHGMTDVIWYAKDVDVKRYRNNVLAPVFKLEDLCRIGNYIYFGHVHEHKSYGPRKQFKYIGPTTRWEIDKDWDCGLYHIYYDKKNELVKEDFIVNELAQQFKTIAISIDHDLETTEIHQLLQPAVNLATEYDRVRVIVNINRGLSTIQPLKDTMLTKANQYPNLQLIFKLVGEEEQEEMVTETPDERNLRIANYIQTPEDVRIQDFIKSKLSMEIPISVIRDVTGYNKIKATEDETS